MTSHRALIAQRDRRGDLVVNTFLPHHAAAVQMRQTADGTDFVLTDERHRPDGFLVDQKGFRQVVDASGAEQALRGLARLGT